MRDYRDVPTHNQKLGSMPANVIPELESFFHPDNYHQTEDCFLVWLNRS